MAILHDFHMHSSFSGDSTATMESMVQSALAKNLKAICITEHYDIDYSSVSDQDVSLFIPDIDAYKAHYMEMANKYRGKIEVLFGMELGLQPHLAVSYYSCIDKYPFDFIIGSVHTCEGVDPYYPQYFFKDMDEEDAYRKYFKSISDNLNAYDGFDSLGHLDYVVRYGPNKDKFYTYEKYKDVLDPILIKLISMGKAIECNTGALVRGLKTTNPSHSVLRRYRELGGELVTIGSDAHASKDIAASFDYAHSILLECGFTHYATFNKRVPQLHKL